MKKFLLLLLVLAGVWYFVGDDESAGVRLQRTADHVHETFATLADADLPSQAERLWDIRTAVEKRLTREHFVPLDDLPSFFTQAIVAIEDRRFYEHGAIDPIGVVRALTVNYRAGETLEGASTITQQTVKTLFLTQERSWLRKAEEVLLASRFEREYTKEEILEIYLNTIYYGAGAYGIGAAAETYFAKTPAEMNLAECALLAGLPQAPSAYDPFHHLDAAKARQRDVLAAMTSQGMISPQKAAAAYEEVLHFTAPAE